MAQEDKERGKVWVLETQTKGTGANMVPLDRVLRNPGSSDPVPGFGFRRPQPREPEPPAPRARYRFRITDVMTREVLAEDVDTRAAVGALEHVRSVVDVIMYVREPDSGRWRMLTLGESQALLDCRERLTGSC